jgi:hypothetical protein
MCAPKRGNSAKGFPLFYCKLMIFIGGMPVADGMPEGKS